MSWRASAHGSVLDRVTLGGRSAYVSKTAQICTQSVIASLGLQTVGVQLTLMRRSPCAMGGYLYIMLQLVRLASYLHGTATIILHPMIWSY